MITIETLKSYHDTPDPLILLCLRQITKDPVNLSRYVLPPELGELIIEAFRDFALTNRSTQWDCINFFKHFKHKNTPLRKLNLSGLPITMGLCMKLLEEYGHQLEELNISRCVYLVDWIDIKKFTKFLSGKTKDYDGDKTDRKFCRSLIIGETFGNLMTKRNPIEPMGLLFSDEMNIRKLVLHKIQTDTNFEDFTISCRLSQYLTPTMTTTLKYLDLSICSIGQASALKHLKSLEILILYNCTMKYPEAIKIICDLKRIRVLDLSRQAIEMDDTDLTPEDPRLLDQLVSSLPLLKRLDISGTNLIGGKDRNITAFETRLDRPFEFLGLFHTGNDAAYRSCIPALTVAGEANESQLLNACEAYIDRPFQLEKALKDLYNYYKTITPSETFDDVNRALDVVLPILNQHLNNEQLIVFTTATLWCIVKINVSAKNLNDAKVRRTITSRLLDVMHYHKSSKNILTNGCLTLLFLPDIICEHSRVAAISLLMCRDPDPRTQGFGTTLLNTLACQVGGDQKIFIGKLKAIETMIEIIKSKIEENTCDEILETAWSTLWNITDETPYNCQRFLEFQGLEAFELCMDKFGENKEVLRNIMGLLGNVAECKQLRIHFMKEEYIRRFYKLLPSHIDGIECSYNACGILAQLLSEGEQFWLKNLDCKRADFWRLHVMISMKKAIASWPINSRRNINYRSFEPIVRLLDVNIDAEAQYWAVFALTNLTRINPAKYCPMLLPHNGLDKMRRLALGGCSKPYVTDLAKVAIHQYERFESEKTLSGLEQCDSVDLEVVRNFRAEPNHGDGASEMGELIS